MKNVQCFIIHEGSGTFFALDECKIVEVVEEVTYSSAGQDSFGNEMMCADSLPSSHVDSVEELLAIASRVADAMETRPPLSWL